MARYIFKRFLWGIVVLVFVVCLIASIIYLAPVDPSRLTFGQRSDAASVQAKKESLGLDKPLYVQLLLYINDLSPFGLKEGKWTLKSPYLRESFQSGRRVSEMMRDAVPKTLILALSSFVIAGILGIFFGLIAALNKDKMIDKILLSATALGYSVPSYVSAIVLAIVFGYWLKAFTGLNVQGSIFELNDMGDEIIVMKNLLLPSIALGIRPLAVITQLTRSSVLDVLSQPYIKTAIAKGLNKKKVIARHTLRNSMNPIASSLSGWLASLMAGAFFVENVFNFKGLGEMTVTALLSYDIPVILASVIFIAAVFVILNIVVDIAYVIIDPCVKLQ